MDVTKHTVVRLVAFCILITMAIFAMDLVTPLGVIDGLLYTVVVLLVLRLPGQRPVIAMAMICTVLTVVGFIFSPPITHLSQVTINRPLSICVIWVATILTLQRKQMEEALRRHQDKLEDLIEVRTAEIKQANQELEQAVKKYKLADAQIKDHNRLLEEAVRTRTQEMEAMTERLIRQEKLAALGQISGSIAHELRNPLGAINQSIFYLKHLDQGGRLETEPARLNKHLDLIQLEVDTANQVITNLLDMTRARPVEPDCIELRPVILEAAVRAQLGTRLELHIDLKPDPFLIWADPVQMQQVLVNLLANAAQACPDNGQIIITARLVDANRQYRLQIQDNGHGIAPDAIDKVFEPLYTDNVAGTGLGLSICKNIVDKHGGSMALTSQAGQGTTIQILLPNLAIPERQT